MVLLIDIGNSNVCFGIVKNNKIAHTFRIKSLQDKSSDEYYLLIKEFINDPVDDVIISSVVPIITGKLLQVFSKYYHKEPMVIGYNIKTGIKLLVDDPKTVGADLICDVAACASKYNEGLIIDLGTASKFIYFKDKALVSVIIAPGISVSTKSLIKAAALLPNFELIAPKKVLNTSTIPCMQSGVIYGFASMVDGLIVKCKKEIGNDNLPIIITGGLSKLIVNYCEQPISEINNNLTMEGIYAIYLKNQKAI